MICDKCGSKVPEGGFLCRNCGNDCRGFMKEPPKQPKQLVYKEAEKAGKKHVGGFISSTEQAMNYGYRGEQDTQLKHIDHKGRMYDPKKQSFGKTIKPYALKIILQAASGVVLLLALISVVWMFLFSEEIGDVAKNVFVTEFINALAVAVGMVGVSFSAIILWLSNKL